MTLSVLQIIINAMKYSTKTEQIWDAYKEQIWDAYKKARPEMRTKNRPDMRTKKNRPDLRTKTDLRCVQKSQTWDAYTKMDVGCPWFIREVATLSSTIMSVLELKQYPRIEDKLNFDMT